MKNIFLTIVLLVLFNNSTQIYSQSYYRSNSIGMVFESLQNYRIDEYDWILYLYEEESIEKRILYFKGEEVSRIEYQYEGNLHFKREYQLNDLIYVEEKENGLVIKEEYYKNNVIINEYLYEWDGRQLTKTIYIENKDIKYEDHFVLGGNGKISQIRRYYSDGQLSTSGFSNVNRGVSTEWYGTENEFLLYKYFEGRVQQIENWLDDSLISNKIYTFSDSGSTVLETDLVTGKIIIEVFDLDDNILSVVTRDGNLLEKITFFYNENLLIQKTVASSGLRVKYYYEYDEDNRLKIEKILKDEFLTKEIIYKEGKKILEKLYKEDSLVLTVTYKNDDKISEEYVQ